MARPKSTLASISDPANDENNADLLPGFAPLIYRRNPRRNSSPVIVCGFSLATPFPLRYTVGPQRLNCAASIKDSCFAGFGSEIIGSLGLVLI
jgi:hypothetical protein